MDENIKKENRFWNYIKMFFKNYVNFKGTATRKEFWMTTLIIGVIYLLLTILMSVLPKNYYHNYNYYRVIVVVKTIIASLYGLGTIIPFVSLYIRRIRDTGRNVICGLLPVFPFIFSALFIGDNSDTTQIVMCYIFFFIGIMAFVVLCCPKSEAYKRDIKKDKLSITKGCLYGWLISFVCVGIIFKSMFGSFHNISPTDLIFMVFGSLVPGAILGAVVTFAINNKNKKEVLSSTLTPSDPVKKEKSLTEQLSELKDLLDKGILTQEEFDEQKKKILNK